MTDDTIKLLQRMADGEVRLTVGAVGAAIAEIKRLRNAALFPPWLADAAVALGKVRPSDDAPLALNWNQVLQEIRDLRDERDGWKANCESWRMVYNAWQDWSTELLHDLGLRPADDCSHGDPSARDIIAGLARSSAEAKQREAILTEQPCGSVVCAVKDGGR